MDKNRAFDSDDDENKQIDKLKKGKSNTPFLDNFGRDLTKIASEGKLDSVIGREDEIDQVIQILNKRRKNNLILVGEPGTGKCIAYDSKVVLRNDLTGEVTQVSIEEFLNTISNT